MSLSKAIFLDRDGVINKLIPDVYVNHWEQFEFIPEALEGLKLLAETDYKIFVVSNQGGIGMGYAGKDEVCEIFSHMKFDIENEYGGRIDKAMFCSHRPDAGCSCRKPKPGMLYTLAFCFNIDLSQSWMIGDMDTDMEAGNAAGIKNLIGIGKSGFPAATTFLPQGNRMNPVMLAEDLLDAAKFIIHTDKHAINTKPHPEPELEVVAWRPSPLVTITPIDPKDF